MNILFNPAYVLKPDGDRILLLYRGGLRSLSEKVDVNFNSYIHPLHAIILSFIDGSDISDIVKRIITYIDIEPEFVRNFINTLIENETDLGFPYNDALLGFPTRTIICSSDKSDMIYNPDDFLLSNISLVNKRHNNVSFLIIMLNNKCSTNCYYCYADKRRTFDCLISFQRLCDIIKEAHELKVVSIDLIGGEVFLYKYWKELLQYLVKYNYSPILSTKHPLEESDISFIAKTNLPLQISLDSMLPETLKSMLSVNNHYISKLHRMFGYLQKYKVKTAVHTILTQRNTTVKDMQSLYEFLSDFDNILYWKPDLGTESIYSKSEYKGTITPLPDKLDLVSSFFNQIKGVAPFFIESGGVTNSADINIETSNRTDKLNKFLSRGFCAGNYSNLFILPDGNVTICEELYWHPRFIIGNIQTQGLAEIWHSERAWALYNMGQEEYPKGSDCQLCKIYDKCRDLKQICYRNILRQHGEDKWYMPDVTCPIQKVL